MLLTASSALALPDLAISVKATPVPGTYEAQFTVTVTNVGDAPAEPSGTAYGFFDVLVFPHNNSQPASDQPGTQLPIEALMPTETALGPGQSWSKTLPTHNYQVPGTYTWWAMVDSISFSKDDVLKTASLAENSKANNIASGQLTLSSTDTDLPDLVLTKVTPKVSGSYVTFDITCGNYGKALAEGGYAVDVMLDPPNNECPPAAWKKQPVAKTDLSPIFAESNDPLVKGGTKTLISTKNAVALSAGSHTACAMIDVQNTMTELNESNNAFSLVTFDIEKPPETEAPDLEGVFLTVQVQGNNVTFTGEVKNSGKGPSQKFDWEIYFDSLTEPVVGQQPDHTATSDALAAGETTKVSYLWQAAPNKAYLPWLCVDLQGNKTAESNEKNNCIQGQPFEVAVVGSIADLVITDATWMPYSDDEIANGIKYFVKVKNQGTALAENVLVGMFFDAESNPDCLTVDATAPQDFAELEVLDPGAEASIELLWKYPDPGVYTGWAKVDCLNTVAELDDTNNDYGPVEAIVKEPTEQVVDLAVVDFKAQANCTNVVYTVSVTNNGIDTSGSFRVDVFRDRGDPEETSESPGFGAEGDYFVEVPSLEPGETVPLNFTNWTDAEDGTYWSWIMVNTKIDVTESDYGNNADGPRQVVIDAVGQQCPINGDISALDGCCACGQVTYTSGYCCYGEWSPSAFDECTEPTTDGSDGDDQAATAGDDGSDSQDGSDSNDSSDGIAGQDQASDTIITSGSVSSAESTGCQSTQQQGQGPHAVLLLLTIAALLYRRKASLSQ